MSKFLILLAVIFSGAVFAQSENDTEPTTITLEAQEIVPPGTATAEFVNIEFEQAAEVFVGPEFVEAEIREGHQVASLYITLASKVNTRVRIVLSDPDLVVTNQDIDAFALFRGTQHSVNFVAFAPHSGTITILNEAGEVLAVVPYAVRPEDHLRHSVSGGVNTSGNVNMSYSLSSDQGWSASTGVGVNSDGEFSGSLNGSYRW